MSPTEAELLVHATCVAWDGVGVLLRGSSGAGKSDLALRLIDQGALLVADDQVALRRRGDALTATPPAALAGLLEVRGIGILRLAHLPTAALGLIIDLVGDSAVERLPEPADIDLLGTRLPALRLCPWPASAVSKVRLAVQLVAGSIMRQS